MCLAYFLFLLKEKYELLIGNDYLHFDHIEMIHNHCHSQ